jgi:membrane protease YdiL (CAAX protease family)
MENPTTPPSAPAETPTKIINLKQVGVFVGVTFALTWLLDLALYLTGGLKSPAVGIALQLQMLLPAFSAILLGMFFFKDSPIGVKTNRGKSRWFNWYFLLFTVVYAAAAALVLVRPEMLQTVGGVMLLPSLIGLVLVIVLRALGGRETFAGVGMGGGKPKLWLLYGLAILAFAGLQTLLNWLFKMGQPADLTDLIAQGTAATGMTAQVFLAVVAVQTVILGPFLGLLIAFGEEYGWRGYLQPALYGLGRVRAVTLVGVIWGVWHWPVIWMGYNYPGHPYLGTLLMLLFCLGLAFVLGYAVLKAGGVWIAAFLHALVNQSFSFFMGFIYTPDDTSFAFGLGIPGLIVLALLVVVILRDPVWKQKD